MSKKYCSIWLVPENDVFKEAQTVINRLAKKYKSSPFTPHVTLVGEVYDTRLNETNSLLKKIASKIKALQVDLDKTDFANTFFQCVFSRVKTSVPLLKARNELDKILLDDNNGLYMPHFSFIYSHISPEVRKRLCEKIDFAGKSFFANKMTIVELDYEIRPTNKFVSGWKVVEEIPFRQ